MLDHVYNMFIIGEYSNIENIPITAWRESRPAVKLKDNISEFR